MWSGQVANHEGFCDQTIAVIVAARGGCTPSHAKHAKASYGLVGMCTFAMSTAEGCKNCECSKELIVKPELLSPQVYHQFLSSHTMACI